MHGNFSIFRSPTKFITYSYFHVDVIDFVGTTTIIISMKVVLIETHSKLIKKGYFTLDFFFVKGKFNYDKGDSDLTIAFTISGVCGEINGKFEFLVTIGTSPENIQIVSTYITLSNFIILYYYIFNK